MDKTQEQKYQIKYNIHNQQDLTAFLMNRIRTITEITRDNSQILYTVLKITKKEK
jgi:hypothetical protein